MTRAIAAQRQQGMDQLRVAAREPDRLATVTSEDIDDVVAPVPAPVVAAKPAAPPAPEKKKPATQADLIAAASKVRNGV